MFQSLKDFYFADVAEIRRFDESMKAETLRFIGSWSNDDVYDRFGSAGTGGQSWLTFQVLKRARPAFVAVNRDGVVGLLDYVDELDGTHLGIFVDSKFRRRRVGTMLVRALLKVQTLTRPVIAESAKRNAAANALLRGSGFKAAARDAYQITWRLE